MKTLLSAAAVAGVLSLLPAAPAQAAGPPTVVATSRCQRVGGGAATVIAVTHAAGDTRFSLEEFRRSVLTRYECLPGTHTITVEPLDG